MRSLPTPRYSQLRTLRRIWRSIVNLFSTGYLSDSAAFASRSVAYRKKIAHTRIRKSRLTRKPTSRGKVISRVSCGLISEIVEDDQLLNTLLRTEKAHNGTTGFSDWVGLLKLWHRGSNDVVTARKNARLEAVNRRKANC